MLEEGGWWWVELVVLGLCDLGGLDTELVILFLLFVVCVDKDELSSTFDIILQNTELNSKKSNESSLLDSYLIRLTDCKLNKSWIMLRETFCGLSITQESVNADITIREEPV